MSRHLVKWRLVKWRFIECWVLSRLIENSLSANCRWQTSHRCEVSLVKRRKNIVHSWAVVVVKRSVCSSSTLMILILSSSFYRISLSLLRLFSSDLYTIKISDFGGFWTRIIREEGKHADHLTTTTTQLKANIPFKVIIVRKTSNEINFWNVVCRNVVTPWNQILHFYVGN